MLASCRHAIVRSVRLRLPTAVSTPVAFHNNPPSKRTKYTRANALLAAASGAGGIPRRRSLSAFSSAPPPGEDPIGSALLDLVTYESVCADTLESLCEYFDHLVETAPHLRNADITFSVSDNHKLKALETIEYNCTLQDGVLTIQFGSGHGTYVINRQSPNRQIWLSSPTTGPKRYDFVPSNAPPSPAGSNLAAGAWVYKHDGRTLHELLQSEIGGIVRAEVDFEGLPFGRRDAAAAP